MAATNPAEDAQLAERNRHMATALHYAHAIQNQKDWEAQILSTIETILDFPHQSPTTEFPSLAHQAKYLAVSLAPFRAGDFDDLIEERRIDSRCGWPLCENSPKATGDPTKAPWKTTKRDREFSGLECAKKAAFLRSQLSPVPVWERGADQNVRLVLPEGDQKLIESISTQQVAAAAAASERQPLATTADLTELAMERGEATTSFRPKQVMLEQVLEKIPKFREPVFDVSSMDVELIGPGSVEGYLPKLDSKSKGGKSGPKPINVSDDESENDDEEEEEELDGLAKDVFQQLKAKE